jgi:CheY-like chemotaxis protein
VQENSTRVTRAIRWLRRRVLPRSSGAAIWKARYQAAQKARLEAESADRAKTVTLARISHDIRTPLMSISGFGDLLMRRGHLTREQRRYVTLIAAASDAVSNIIAEFAAQTSPALQQNETSRPLPIVEAEGMCRGKILVVDDLASNREIIMAYLEDGGCEVVPASTGAEAIALLGKDRFDLILMDIQMPGMDGVAVTRFIRTMDPPLCTIPIIAMTGSVLPQQVHSFINAGMNDHIGKPIERKKLYGKLWCWLPRKIENAAPETVASSPLFNHARLEELVAGIGQRKVERALRDFAGQLSGCFHSDITASRREAHDLINAAGLLGFEQLLDQAMALKDSNDTGLETPLLMADCRLTRDAVLDVIATTVLPLVAAPGARKAS